MTSRIAISVAVAAMVSLGACHSTSAAPRGASTSRSVLTSAELQDDRFITAWDAVDALRGNWLHDRGTASFTRPTEILVYLDGVRHGGVSSLRDIPVVSVENIRFFSGMDASTRWGLDHGKGVIYVTSKAGRPPSP